MLCTKLDISSEIQLKAMFSLITIKSELSFQNGEYAQMTASKSMTRESQKM
jgi:hypothetical protein